MALLGNKIFADVIKDRDPIMNICVQREETDTQGEATDAQSMAEIRAVHVLTQDIRTDHLSHELEEAGGGPPGGFWGDCAAVYIWLGTSGVQNCDRRAFLLF
jgi:hypothetical protein